MEKGLHNPIYIAKFELAHQSSIERLQLSYVNTYGTHVQVLTGIANTTPFAARISRKGHGRLFRIHC